MGSMEPMYHPELSEDMQKLADEILNQFETFTPADKIRILHHVIVVTGDLDYVEESSVPTASAVCRDVASRLTYLIR